MTLYRANYIRRDGTKRTLSFASVEGHRAAYKFAQQWTLEDKLQQVDALTTGDLFAARRFLPGSDAADDPRRGQAEGINRETRQSLNQ